MSELRTLPVPDGLEGERLDAGLARLFGFSRTKAAELATAGLVTVDGAVVGKSDRLRAGSVLEVEIPTPAAPVGLVAEVVAGLRIIHDDEHVVVVDKPVGVAAHPSPGWAGPTVIGGRYGLSSKEFTPAMVKAIYDELAKPQPKNHFKLPA